MLKRELKKRLKYIPLLIILFSGLVLLFSYIVRNRNNSDEVIHLKCGSGFRIADNPQNEGTSSQNSAKFIAYIFDADVKKNNEKANFVLCRDYPNENRIIHYLTDDINKISSRYIELLRQNTQAISEAKAFVALNESSQKIERKIKLNKSFDQTQEFRYAEVPDIRFAEVFTDSLLANDTRNALEKFNINDSKGSLRKLTNDEINGIMFFARWIGVSNK